MQVNPFRLAPQAGEQEFPNRKQFFGQAIIQLDEEFFMREDFLLPLLFVDLHDLIEVLFGEALQAAPVNIFVYRYTPKLGFHSGGFGSGAIHNPLEDTHVLFQFESKKDKNLIGTFKIDTGESTIINEMRTDLTTVEERQTVEGETIQVIEGTIDVGRDRDSAEYSLKLNGTLTVTRDNLILDLKGTK